MALCSLVVVSTEGCVHASTGNSQSTNRNILTRAQIDARYTTAYDAVEGLRSNWLNTRGMDSFSNPSVVRVYLDNTSLGDKETLKTIAIASISYIRWFDAAAATQRWGTNHGAGVIYVSTRPPGAGDPQP